MLLSQLQPLFLHWGWRRQDSSLYHLQLTIHKIIHLECTPFVLVSTYTINCMWLFEWCSLIICSFSRNKGASRRDHLSYHLDWDILYERSRKNCGHFHSCIDTDTQWTNSSLYSCLFVHLYVVAYMCAGLDISSSVVLMCKLFFVVWKWHVSECDDYLDRWYFLWYLILWWIFPRKRLWYLFNGSIVKERNQKRVNLK